MAGRFEGKTALVTGGSRGIGKAIVKALINEGAKVYALGKSRENLEKLQSDIPTVYIVQADVTDWDSTRQAVEKLGIIDFLVNNPGTNMPHKKCIDIEKSAFDKVLDTNFKGSFNIAQVVSKGMVSAGRPGVIINMSSIYGLKSHTKNLPYSVSKAMMEMLTKVMALELGPHKIRVNSINPTYIRTGMAEKFMNNKEFIDPILQRHPIGHFGEVKDVVNATLWLLSDEAAMVTGTSLPVDGGFLIS